MIKQLKRYFCNYKLYNKIWDYSFMHALRILGLIVIFTLAAAKEAQAFKFTKKICEEYGLGKSWYCEDEHSEEQKEVTANDVLNSSLPPEAKALALNVLWERQRKVAVITGKKEDLENFLTTQYIIAEKGVDF